jgi:hypothetical protein
MFPPGSFSKLIIRFEMEIDLYRNRDDWGVGIDPGQDFLTLFSSIQTDRSFFPAPLGTLIKESEDDLA